MNESAFLAYYAESDRVELLEHDAARRVAWRLRRRGVEVAPDDALDHLIWTYGQMRLHLLRSGDVRASNPITELRRIVQDAARCLRCGEVDWRVLDGAKPHRVEGQVICVDCHMGRESKR